MITFKVAILAIAPFALMPLATIPLKSFHHAADISVKSDLPPLDVRGSVFYKTSPAQHPSQGKTSLPRDIFERISSSHIIGPHQMAMLRG